MKRVFLIASLLLLVAIFTFATPLSDSSRNFGKAPSVTMAPVSTVKLARGKSVSVQFDFRVERGFHINSNQPKDEFLVPTELKLDPPSDVVVGRITYPPGQDRSFPFAPGETLSVYSGDFSVRGLVTTTRTISPGTYRVRGTLKYQACDNAACYPPKALPIHFDVKVVKPARSYHRNTGQSPHIH